MTPADWLRDLRGRGVELWFEGERLRFRAPRGALSAEDRAALAARRAEVLAHLRAEAASTERTAPLSFSQQSLWFIAQQAPGSTAYHVGLAVRLMAATDAAALRHAFQALVDRHATLRTTYPVVGGVPCQRIAGAAEAAFEVRDALGLDEAGLRAAVEAEHRRPFDLERGPVLRAVLFRRGPEDHVLLVSVHHIAADGWSVKLLADELIRLYVEATGGPPAALARPSAEYADYARWQEQMLAGPEGERLAEIWRARLTPLPPPLDLPADRPRPASKTFLGASLRLALPAATTAAVKALARQEATTPFVVLLAAFQAFLFRLSGAEDLVVGTPAFAREKPEFVGIVGDFVNSVPLRGRPTAGLPFRDFVAQLKAVVLEALEAQEMPLPLLVRQLHLERDSSRSPLFDAFFNLYRFEPQQQLPRLMAGMGPDDVVVDGVRAGAFPLPQQEGQFDLAVQLNEREGEIQGYLNYSTDLFDEGTARGYADGYLAVVEAALRDPGALLGALPRPAAGESAAAVLERLGARDIHLRLDGDKLRVNAPKGAVDAELKALLATRRDALVDALRRAQASEPAAGPRRIPRDGPLPVTSAQHRLWFLDRVDPGHSQYNVCAALRLRGPLDPEVMRRAVDALVRRHESLRTRIGERDGAPLVEILDAGPGLEVADVSGLPAEARDAEARRVAAERLARPFDLARGPLAGFHLVRVAPDHHLLGFSMHHVVSDGWSLDLAMRDLCALYDALAAGRAPALPPLPVQYVDYAAWERERLHAGRMAPQLAYWKQELAGAPALLELPTDRPRPAALSSRGRRFAGTVDAALLRDLKALARAHDATLFMTLLAAFQVLLHRYSGQDDVLVGSPVANRDHPALERVVGCFVNNLVLRGRLGGNPTFAEFLARLKGAVLGAFEHRDLPFDVLVEAVQPERSAGHAPVFQVLFALHTFMTDLPHPAGLRAEEVEPTERGEARFDLALDVAELGGQLRIFYEYATDLFDEGTIARLHANLERLLRAVVADPAGRVDDLPLRGAEEDRLLAAWNDTGLEHDRARCVHHLLEAAARAAPDATAVVSGGASLTYRELDAGANRLAQLLVRRGVAPGALVAVCVDRTWDMPLAIAAVLKAGAAYVPLDPTHPADRLRYTLGDAGVACAITLGRFAPLLAEAGAPLVRLDEVEAELGALPATPPPVAARPEDRAYVIYTSGSTGRPKGVEVEHRNVVAFLEAMRRAPGFTASDVLLAVTTLSFDIAGLELWLPLGLGARVVIASRAEVLDGARLAELLEEHRVTVMQATPATWRLMLEAGWAGKSDLKVLCGGEAMPRDLAAALLPRVGELWNMYGPTETTIWSTCCRVVDPAAPITVGRPIENTRVHVLERSGQPAPVGVPGELCIGGEGVARGYHDRPELTAEKFVTVELGGRPERLYRTGDVARFRPDGTLDFLGRRDHQVKVRGYRIELGEIEAVLASHPGVHQCVTAVREDAPGDQRLVGYVVPEAGTAFDPEAARATLRAKLPEYMVPNLFVTMAALPLTPNGKIDRKALPAPVAGPAAAAPASAAVADALMTPAQRTVAAVWREVLRSDRVGLHDNFFDVGGHSLLLVKLHAALRREFATELALVELFQWTTVAAQAARLSAPPPSDSALRRAQARAARQIHE